MIAGHLSVRRQLVDDLRQHLRQSARGRAGRDAALLRDATDGAAAEDLRQLVFAYRQVRAGAYPRIRVFAQSGLPELAEDAGQTAVLLESFAAPA